MKGKYIICAKCGIVGRTLVKKGDEYDCDDVRACKARQLIAKQVCSHPECKEPARYTCSCGLFVCLTHTKIGDLHPGHMLTPLSEDKDGKESHHNTKQGKDKPKLYIK